MKSLPFLFEITRIALMILFVYTGCSKLIGHALFVEQLSKIPVLQHAAGFLSVFVPLSEIVAAIALAFPKTEMAGWWVCSILLSCFSIYIVAMLSFVPRLPCSCGGIIAALSWKQHLALNTALATMGWLKLYQHYFILKFRMHTRE